MNKLSVLVSAVLLVLAAGNEQNDAEILRINQAQNLWQAGHNPISEKGVDYVKKLLGTFLPDDSKDEIVRKPTRVAKSKGSGSSIPTSFDARKNWPHCASIASIKDQGLCGSCWAIAAASVASDRLCIRSNGNITVNISAENLLACCTYCAQTTGCDGGWPERAWRYMLIQGVVTGGGYHSNEGCQPYEVPPTGAQNLNTPQCSNDSCTNSLYTKRFKKDKHFAYFYNFVPPKDPDQIQTAIMTTGPVQASFEVYADFPHYTRGIYKYTYGKFLGGHSVKIIGWGKNNETGVDYWIVSNSWGSSWGENGTFRIRRGTDECMIEKYVLYGDMILTESNSIQLQPKSMFMILLEVLFIIVISHNIIS